MTVQELKDKNCILFECISGSQAYGLATPQSDVDIKGVFVLPQEEYYSLTYIDQINENNNNIAYYELKKFIELLYRNNPNILEMLNMPKDCILYQHKLFSRIKADFFLSKLCKETFAGYAGTQLKKARGLNKKILNPMDEKRKSVLDFCFVAQDQGSIPVEEYLNKNGITQEKCGLVAIPHMRNLFGLYYEPYVVYKGIVSSDEAMDVSLSSVERDKQPIAFLSFNKDGYSKYCKDYTDYFNWVENRNDVRYENTVAHGKNYDAKNMMHTFRLLDMALEIGCEAKLNVRRPNREFLLKIKSGTFEYDDLLDQAEQKLEEVEKVFTESTLKECPDLHLTNQLLISIRKDFYAGRF